MDAPEQSENLCQEDIMTNKQTGKIETNDHTTTCMLSAGSRQGGELCPVVSIGKYIFIIWRHLHAHHNRPTHVHTPPMHNAQIVHSKFLRVVSAGRYLQKSPKIFDEKTFFP